MSAIFGRLSFDGRPVSSSTLRAMQESMSYWGPDGDGLWSEGPVGLGHLKRNNTPKSLGESLPWLCPASGDVITASARLDNRDELLEALSIPAPGAVSGFAYWGTEWSRRDVASPPSPQRPKTEAIQPKGASRT